MWAIPANELQAHYLVSIVRKGYELPDEIQDILDSLELDKQMSGAALAKEMQARILDIHRLVYQRIADTARASGALPVMVLIPAPDGEAPEDIELVSQMAVEAGFILLDLTDVFTGYTPSDLYVAPWDRHPNELGHELIANRLYNELQSNPALVSWCP